MNTEPESTIRAFPGESSSGLSMLDYVAIKAIPALIAAGYSWEYVAVHAYKIADEFMAERAKRETPRETA